MIRVELYDKNGKRIRGSVPGFKTSKAYRRTNWYKNLPWFYTTKPVTVCVIKDAKGNELERVDRSIPD